jgi:hypothetical protein
VKPFVEGLDVDPWGASYLVNIRNLDLNLDNRNLESDQPYDRHHAMVISGGPNGIIETADTTKSNEQGLLPGGDDIISLIE